MRLGQRSANGQPQPQAVARARRGLALLEWLEYPGQGLRTDADPVVGHLDHQAGPAVDPGVGAVAGADGDLPAGRGEPDGVFQQVPDNLLEPYRVALDVV